MLMNSSKWREFICKTEQLSLKMVYFLFNYYSNDNLNEAQNDSCPMFFIYTTEKDIIL